MAVAWRALTLSVVHGAPSLFDLLLLAPLVFPCFDAPLACFTPACLAHLIAALHPAHCEIQAQKVETSCACRLCCTDQRLASGKGKRQTLAGKSWDLLSRITCITRVPCCHSVVSLRPRPTRLCCVQLHAAWQEKEV